MAGHGGYRRPTNPAPVSGPGAHSKRTDGKQPKMQLPDAKYGEQQDYQDIQSGAPMAQVNGQPAVTQQPITQNFTPMGAPSTQPDVPVTNGAQYGAGAGQEALNTTGVNPNQEDAQFLARYMPTLVSIAESDDTPPGTKRWIRAIIASQ